MPASQLYKPDGTTYYKVLTSNGKSNHGGDYTWDLPNGGKPGAWTEPITDLDPCRSGYHIVTLQQLPQWLNSVGLWEIEPRGQIIHVDNKSVCESARLVRRVEQWNPRTIRLLAALWVEHLIPEYSNSKDVPTLRTLIDVTRSYADNQGATLKDVEAVRQTASLSSSTLLSLSSSLTLLSLSSSLTSSRLSSSLTLSLTLLSLSSSSRRWLRDRWVELITASGDWSHVDWTEW